jgi:hypothetical protein
MDSNTFVHSGIVDFFYEEWYESPHKVYKDFIKSKDMGIELVENLRDEKTRLYQYNVFRIINEKKWLLAKIKYGF